MFASQSPGRARLLCLRQVLKPEPELGVQNAPKVTISSPEITDIEQAAQYTVTNFSPEPAAAWRHGDMIAATAQSNGAFAWTTLAGGDGQAIRFPLEFRTGFAARGHA
jgi:hypothetical protein